MSECVDLNVKRLRWIAERLASYPEHDEFIEWLRAAADRITGDRERIARMGAFERLVSDLDRCEHGRHEGDACQCPGGVSLGGVLPTGSVIGHTIHATHVIVVPPRGDRHRPEAWIADTPRKDTP